MSYVNVQNKINEVAQESGAGQNSKSRIAALFTALVDFFKTSVITGNDKFVKAANNSADDEYNLIAAESYVMIQTSGDTTTQMDFSKGVHFHVPWDDGIKLEISNMKRGLPYRVFVAGGYPADWIFPDIAGLNLKIAKISTQEEAGLNHLYELIRIDSNLVVMTITLC